MDMKLASEVANLLSCHDSGDVDATVRIAIHSLARVIAENERMRNHVTGLQRSNTALEERARSAEKSAREAGGGAPSTAFSVIDDLAQQRDEARRERDEANILIANTGIALGWDAVEGVVDAAKRVTKERDEARAEAAKQALDFLKMAREDDDALRSAAGDTTKRNVYDVVVELRKERDEARKQRDEDCRYLNECRSVRDDALKALASVTASRDALASSSVPVELARLYRAAQGSRARWEKALQEAKLSEECGEFIAEECRQHPRRDDGRVASEAHDVLTVALSLCEPALMAKAAERLEGRLA